MSSKGRGKKGNPFGEELALLRKRRKGKRKEGAGHPRMGIRGGRQPAFSALSPLWRKGERAVCHLSKVADGCIPLFINGKKGGKVLFHYSEKKG